MFNIEYIYIYNIYIYIFSTANPTALGQKLGLENPETFHAAQKSHKKYQ